MIDENPDDPSGVPSLPIWVIYDHPIDFPDWFVARKFLNDQPSSVCMASHDLGMLRLELETMGHFCIPRFDGDDPCIIETWI